MPLPSRSPECLLGQLFLIPEWLYILASLYPFIHPFCVKGTIWGRINRTYRARTFLLFEAKLLTDAATYSPLLSQGSTLPTSWGPVQVQCCLSCVGKSNSGMYLAGSFGSQAMPSPLTQYLPIKNRHSDLYWSYFFFFKFSMFLNPGKEVGCYLLALQRITFAILSIKIKTKQ